MLYFGTFKLRMEIELHLRFVFVRHYDVFSSCDNYVIYLFDAVTYFDDLRITLYFSIFDLRMEIKLQLRFIFGSSL